METLVVVLVVVALVAGGVLLGRLLGGRRAPAPVAAAPVAPPPVPVEEVLREFEARAAQDRAAQAAATEAAVAQLVRTNQEMLAAERRLGTQELEGKKSLIDQELHGMRGDLAKLTGLIHQVESERQKHTGELTSQLQEAGRHTQTLADTTQSLREALSSTTARGQWGERMAEDVLRLAGFVDGVNYRKRQAIAGSGGIPDYTFLLPQGLSLHMDVKFPLNNYMRYLDATSDVEPSTRRKISDSPRTSSIAVGSSRSTTSAPAPTLAIARARATRCHWPPDRSTPPGYPLAIGAPRSARPSAPARSSAASTSVSSAPSGATLSRRGSS